MKIDLNGKWSLSSATYSNLEADVPGSVLSTLLAHNLIADPFYGENEETVRQCLRENYSFTRKFSMTKQQLHQHNFLFLEGVDTLAKVYINGKLIVELFDMHTRKRIALDGSMLAEENEIRVEFSNVYDYIENYPGKESFRTFAITHPNGPVIRKSHHMLGWDWGPDLADMGIYRDIYILSTDLGYLNSFRHECTFLDDGSVRIDVDTEICSFANGKVTATLSLEDTCLTAEKPLDDDCTTLSFLVKEPKLWYPIGFGEPTLYDLTFTLAANNGETQQYAYRIGIRQVEIDNSPDEYGTNFCVRING